MYGYDVHNFEELYDTFMYMMSNQHMSYLFVQISRLFALGTLQQIVILLLKTVEQLP